MEAILFTSVVPNEYYVTFSQPTGYKLSPASGVAGVDTDSDVNSTLRTATTRLDSNETDTTWDMGLYQTASVGDKVWIDVNGDGIQNDSKVLDFNVTVVLINDTNHTTTATTIVEAGTNGSYLFDFLTPADYHVEFILPNRFTI